MQRCGLPHQISKKTKPSTKCKLLQRSCQVLFSEIVRYQTSCMGWAAVEKNEEEGIGWFG